jgi:tetratricopeptide (TPR) repeat protein
MMIRVLMHPSVYGRYVLLHVAYLSVVSMGILWAKPVRAQHVMSTAGDPTVRIEQERRMIEAGEKTGLGDSKLGYLWSTLATAYQDGSDGAHALSAFERALQLLGKDAKDRANYATTLDNLGSLYLQYGRVSEAEVVRRRALTIRKEIGDPMGIAHSEQHVAEVELAKHRFKEAEKGARAALAMEAAAGSDPVNVSMELSALVTLTFAECMRSKPEDALQDAERAMKLVESAFPNDTVERAHVSMALGFAEWKAGNTVEAESRMQEGMRVLRERLGMRSPVLLAAMYEYSWFLKGTGRGEELEAVQKQIDAMREEGVLRSCKDCSVSAYALK